MGASHLVLLEGKDDAIAAVREQTSGKFCDVVIECTGKQGPLDLSAELTKERGYLQYRFGLPGKIELQYPEQREQSQRAFKYSHYFRAQVDMTEISFSREGHEYAIFDDYNGEEKPPRHEQGVKITAPNKEWTLNCRGRAKAQFGDLSNVLEQQPEPQ